MRILYSLLLVGVVMVWGWTFVAVRGVIALYGVLGFLSVRFALAAALTPHAARKVPRPTLVAGASIGFVLTTEAVFAALFGYWLAGDKLVLVQIFGVALILSALVASEVAPVVVDRSKPHEKGDVSR